MGHRGETCKSDYNLEVESFRLLFSFFHMPVYRSLWIWRSPGKGCPKHLNARVGEERLLQRSEQFLWVLAFTCLILWSEKAATRESSLSSPSWVTFDFIGICCWSSLQGLLGIMTEINSSERRPMRYGEPSEERRRRRGLVLPSAPTAHCLGSLAAHNVAEPAAHGDGKVEQGEHLAPQFAHKHVGNQESGL